MLIVKISANILINFFNYTRLVIFLLYCIFDLSIYKILKYKVITMRAKNLISKVYFAYLQIFDAIVSLQEKRFFTIVFAIILL